jgi:hypothetical protein
MPPVGWFTLVLAPSPPRLALALTLTLTLALALALGVGRWLVGAENHLSPDLVADMRVFLAQSKNIQRSAFYEETLSVISPKLRGLVNAQVHGSWIRKLQGYWKLTGVPVGELNHWLLHLVTRLLPKIYIPGEHVISKDELPGACSARAYRRPPHHKR